MRLHLVYFSPTYTTRDMLKTMSESFSCEVFEHDLTEYARKDDKLSFNKDDVVIFGLPVYGGRVPLTAAERLKNISGKATPAALLVTYGNRDYDDALLELNDLMQERGFRTVAAAAFVTEHSIVREIGAGRPDSKDFSLLRDFSDKFMARLAALPDKAAGTLAIKGNKPYQAYKRVPLVPSASSACVKCGLCVIMCPVRAISADNPRKTNKKLCISCMRCIRVCPEQARKNNWFMLFLAKKFLKKHCKEQKQPEIFV